MDYIRCRCCGAKLYDGDPALCKGTIDSYSTYCMDCRDEFFESVRDTIDSAYGYEDEYGMLWMYDENSTVYRDLDDFIEAEAERIAYDMTQYVYIVDPGEGFENGYPEQLF
jgi:hypothetical protein